VCGCSTKKKLVVAISPDASKFGLNNAGEWWTTTVKTGKRVGTGLQCIFTALPGPCRMSGEWAALRLVRCG
jgi:hypothetical protein